MEKDVLVRLDYIINKYSSMPDDMFLLYEVYLDNGKDDISYVFEVLEYDPVEAEKGIIDQEPDRTYNKEVEVLRLTSLSSITKEGKKYTPFKGKDIAFRAMRLKRLLDARYIQPPGVVGDDSNFGIDIAQFAQEDDGEDYKKGISCSMAETCSIIKRCPKNKKYSLKGLRYCTNRIEDTKVLQMVLMKLGYADEMGFSVYGADGLYGKRTRLAVSTFVYEINYLEKIRHRDTESKPEKGTAKEFEPISGDFIGSELAEEIIRRCEQGWTRKSYWFFKDSRWDLYPGIQGIKDEFSIIKQRYHVRQLQRDLKYFNITRMSYLPGSDKYNSINENIDKLWIDGVFDKWTQRAVLQFIDAAKAGARFDPIRREMVFPYTDNPTFKGRQDGVVDEETKNEIERWHDYVHNILSVENVVVEDYSRPSVKLSGSKIVAPMFACSALVKENENVNILLACPLESDNIEITSDDIRKNLNRIMFLHEPADKKRPFLCDDYVPNKIKEDKYTVVEVAEADESSGLFYKGTKNPEVFKIKAENIDSWYEEEVNHSITEDTDYKEIVRKKIWDIYDRKYPGLLEKLKEEGLKLWKVVIKLNSNVKPGFHLLKIKDGNDLKPHPVRVFPSEKEEYKVIHLTDLHIASRYDELFDSLGDSLPHYNNPNDRLREFIEKARYIRPDLVIITGDAVDNANNYRPYDTHKGKHIFKSVVDMDSNWRRLHYILTTEPGIDVPVYISLGDHDFKHNPASIQHRYMDLNISQEEAENYTYDTVDSNSTGAVSKWRFSKSLGDTLYADENAAQYYFENFSPFTDFCFNIENLNFILMNSGPDKNIFISDYSIAQQWDETWAYVRQVLSGDAPAPTSQGFGERQVLWLKKIIEAKGNSTNIFCMHSNVINPSVTGLMLKENALKDDLDADRITPEEMLVGMGGIMRLEGWGCEDIIDREGWLTEFVRNKLRSLAGDLPRRWMPMAVGDLEYILEKIKIINNIIEDLKMGKELSHSELYVLPEEKYPQEMRDSWYPALMQELENLKNNLNFLLEIDYSVSSIDKGRGELLKLFENGSLKIALTGHSHKNMEFRCERKDGKVKWYSGNYSDYDECLDYFNQRGDGLVISTACTGFLGTEDTYDHKNNEYGKKYEKAWYRMLSISSNGRIRGFGKISLGDKNDLGLY
jgi:hypothetical protein